MISVSELLMYDGLWAAVLTQSVHIELHASVC